MKMLKSSKNILISSMSLAKIQYGSDWNIQQTNYCYLDTQMIKRARMF